MNGHEYGFTTGIDGHSATEHPKAALPSFFRYCGDLSFGVIGSVSSGYLRIPRLGNTNYS